MGAERIKKTFQGLASVHYETMKTKDICDLPVKSIADDNCALFLWVTPPQLGQGLQVMKAWGFKYKTVGFTWIKTYKNGEPFFGLGYWTRSNSELCLIGTKGNIKRVDNTVPQVVISEIEKHSKKPDEVRNRIVKLMGDIPRVELFAREKYDGWDSWGNEVVSDIDWFCACGERKENRNEKDSYTIRKTV